MTQPDMELVFSSDQIQQKVRRLALEISETYKDRKVVLVGVLNGVFMFFSDLARNLTIPAEVDFIRLASYQDTSSTGRVIMTKDVEYDLTGKDVIIVEDIVDSGLTMNWLKKHLAAIGANSIATCVLINKLERRDVRVDIDYVGFEVESGFLIGYGLDFNGQYRCLPAIYHLSAD